MDTATPGEHRVWGVRCGDGEVLWVDDEAAAHRLLVSLIGAQQIVRRAESDEPSTS
jgi:hypothetical protein